ncbi:hypothetical protein UlMin_045213, partial [Ulmus minor]
ICEDIPQIILDLDAPWLSEWPINIFLSRLFQFFQSPHSSLRKLSLSSVNQYIMLMPAAFYGSISSSLFVLANDPNSEVWKLVCSALAQLIKVRPSFFLG